MFVATFFASEAMQSHHAGGSDCHNPSYSCCALTLVRPPSAVAVPLGVRSLARAVQRERLQLLCTFLQLLRSFPWQVVAEPEALHLRRREDQRAGIFNSLHVPATTPLLELGNALQTFAPLLFDPCCVASPGPPALTT